MKVLVACEFSGIVREAFASRGHHTVSCDLLPTERPTSANSEHYQGDVRDILHLEPWDLLIAHPPCTYLTNSGVRWLYKGGRKGNGWDEALLLEMEKARHFFLALWNANIPRICVENPVPHGLARLPGFTQSVQPWQFGHGEVKRTCLWLKNLPPLVHTNKVGGRYPRVHRESPGEDRWKKRSITYQGIADAMAEQWG